MQIDFTNMDPSEAYKWMSNTIVPRPIAWVSTISAAGITNLAPFSYFQGIASKPPTLMFVPVNDRIGLAKDTVRNLEEVPEFVVNLVSEDLANQMTSTSTRLPYGESEFEHFGILSAPSINISPPRVAQAPLAFECCLDRIVVIGEGAYAANVVFGTIISAYIQNELLAGGDTARQLGNRLIGRIGSSSYVRLTDRFA